MTHQSCPSTPEHLRPMSARRARGLSRKYHLALATLNADHANLGALARLFVAVGTAWGIHETRHGRNSAEQRNFEIGWSALLTYLEQFRANRPVHMSVSEATVLEQLLTLHDTQLAMTPAQELGTANQHFAHLLSLLGRSDTSALVEIGSANRLELSDSNELMTGDEQAEKSG
ncbi:hypothetical protein [Burkholderia ubonensis]|nr:hypothetical protein [Burkholderia ubonensis]